MLLPTPPFLHNHLHIRARYFNRYLRLGRGRAVGGVEDAEVDEPSARVELGVDGLNLPGVLAAGGRLDGLHDNVADDRLGRQGRRPADDDGVAGVPDVELLEGWEG